MENKFDPGLQEARASAVHDVYNPIPADEFLFAPIVINVENRRCSASTKTTKQRTCGQRFSGEEETNKDPKSREGQNTTVCNRKAARNGQQGVSEREEAVGRTRAEVVG